MGWMSQGICGAIALCPWGATLVSLPASATLDAIAPAVERLPVPITNPLPTEFPSFNSQQFDQQLQRYLRFLSEAGTPDILIVGSSRSGWGIDPIVLQRAMSDRGYGNLKIFNFAVNGATAQVVDWLLRALLSPDQLPRLIVWGDGLRAFNSGRVDATYRNLVDSEGFQAIAAGTRPTPLPPAQFRLGQFCLEVPPSYVASLSPSLSPSLSSSFPVEPPAIAPDSAAPTDELLCHQRIRLFRRFGLPAKLSNSPESIATLHEATGFLAKPEQFNPDTYFQRYPPVPGEYDSDYSNFSLVGEQTIALEKVLSYAADHKIPIVFVNLPLTDTYLDPVRRDSEAQFRDFLQQFALAQRMTVYDLSLLWPTRYDYFVDPSHLNRFGAEAIARHLGKILVMPP